MWRTRLIAAVFAAFAWTPFAVAQGDGADQAQPNNLLEQDTLQQRPATALGIDYPRTAQRPVRGGQPSNRWRYEYYNGYWWFWTPRDQWAYFDGQRWNTYDPASLLARGAGGRAMRSALGGDGQAVAGSQSGRGGFGGYGGYGQGRNALGGSLGRSGASRTGASSLGPMARGSNPLGGMGNAGAMGRGRMPGLGTTPGRSARSGISNPGMGATAGGLGVSGAGGSVMGGAGGSLGSVGSGASLLGGGGGSLGTTAVPGVSGTRGSIGGGSGVGIGSGLGRSGDAGSGVGGGMVGGAGVGGTGGGN